MTLHSPSFSSRVFLCVCHAAVSLIPNWKEEHAQIKAKKIREKPICGCFFVCCDIDQLKIEIRHSTSWYLKSTNEKSEFAPSVLTENLIWREKQLKVTSIVFWLKLHKIWKMPIWLTWIIVTLIRSRNKFSESFFFVP